MATLIIGLGALGTVVAQRLCEEGVSLILQDYDIVREGNLDSTPFFTREDIGRPKASIVRERLGGEARLEAFGPKASLAGVEAIADCTDDLRTKLLVNDMAMRGGIPLVTGAAGRDRGLVCAGCLQCVMRGKVPVDDCAQGIEPQAAAAIGSAQSNLILGALRGEGERVLLSIGEGARRIKVRGSPRCDACQGRYVHINVPFSLAFCAGTGRLQARPSRPGSVSLEDVPGEVLERYPSAVLVRLGDGTALVHRHGLVEFDSVTPREARAFARRIKRGGTA